MEEVSNMIAGEDDALKYARSHFPLHRSVRGFWYDWRSDLAGLNGSKAV